MSGNDWKPVIPLIKAVVSPDASKAELIIPAKLPVEELKAETCLKALSATGIEMNPAVVQKVEAFIAGAQPSNQEQHIIVAERIAPVLGADGYIQWFVGDKKVDAERKISHYDRSAFIMVKRGQVIARVVPPVHGKPGKDVYGRSLAPPQVSAARYQLDRTVAMNQKRQFIAQIDGVLTQEGGRIAVRKFLEVPHHVDFSTGNIDFDGDVFIHSDVRDRFVVKASGYIEVHGLIEAATIQCSGNLIARGGFCGRERGHATVSGDLLAKYLNNVEATVRGDVIVDREILNCDLKIGGDLNSPRVSVMGGRCSVTGKMEVSALGSPGHVTTEIILGRAPVLEADQAALHEVLITLEAKRHGLEQQRETLLSQGAAQRGSAKAERLATIDKKLADLKARLSRGANINHAIQTRLEAERQIDVRIKHALYQGVLIVVGHQLYRIHETVKGPLRIQRINDDIVYARQDAAPVNLVHIAEAVQRTIAAA